MTILSNADFASQVLSMAAPVASFKAVATYDPDGDCIEFLTKPDSFRAERIDDLVTVYYSQDTGEVIGSLVKNVKKFFRETVSKHPGVKLVIQAKPVRLEHIFLAKLFASNYTEGQFKTMTYQKLIDASRETEVEGELCMV